MSGIDVCSLFAPLVFVLIAWSSIDGVLLRSSKPISGAAESLSLLKQQGIPFILLTNGGGKHETERVVEINEKLQVQLDSSAIIQSHSPFAELVKGADEATSLENKCVMVVGGDGDNCRRVAEQYVGDSLCVSAGVNGL